MWLVVVMRWMMVGWPCACRRRLGRCSICVCRVGLRRVGRCRWTDRAARSTSRRPLRRAVKRTMARDDDDDEVRRARRVVRKGGAKRRESCFFFLFIRIRFVVSYRTGMNSYKQHRIFVGSPSVAADAALACRHGVFVFRRIPIISPTWLPTPPAHLARANRVWVGERRCRGEVP